MCKDKPSHHTTHSQSPHSSVTVSLRTKPSHHTTHSQWVTTQLIRTESKDKPSQNSSFAVSLWTSPESPHGSFAMSLRTSPVTTRLFCGKSKDKLSRHTTHLQWVQGQTYSYHMAHLRWVQEQAESPHDSFVVSPRTSPESPHGQHGQRITDPTRGFCSSLRVCLCCVVNDNGIERWRQASQTPRKMKTVKSDTQLIHGCARQQDIWKV